jgi:hypothetical protein
MRRIFLSSVCVLLALGAIDCDKLGSLPQGTCGNGVVDAGEDCDGFANEQGFTCRAADSDWACSFECKADRTCPTGYGCGQDGVCRKPLGTFSPDAFAVAPSQAEELLSGDFDGDGRADVVSIEAGRFRVSFIDDAGTLQQSSISSDARPAIGKVGALNTVSGGDDSAIDKTDDIVLPLHLGIGTLLSQGDRTFTAKTYASVTLGDEKIKGVGTVTVTGVLPLALDALPDNEAHPGDETAAFTSTRLAGSDMDDPAGYFVNFGAGGSQPVFTVPDTHPDDLSGPPVLQNMDESDKCQEILFPKTGANKLLVFKPCKKTKDGFDWLHYPEDQAIAQISSIDVGGAVAGPVFAYDLNSDGHVDMLVPATVGGSLQLRVAFGIGNGTFHSQDPIGQNPPVAKGDGATSKVADLESAPLALGALNGDAFPDIVDATHVRLGAPTNGGLSFSAVVYQSQHPWTEAVIARVNADQYADVVASSENSPDLDVLTGNASPLLNPFTVSTDGNVAHLRIGDYDGDLINDIAFQEALSSTESYLMIAYGKPFGGPEVPQQVGVFPDIHSIVSGNVLTFGADAITDLGVLSSFETTADVSSIKEAFAVSFFPGSSDRFLQAPFLLAEPPDNRLEVPIQTSMGFLRAWAPGGSEEAHNDVAILAYSPPQYDPKMNKLDQDVDALRLWGLFTTGDADFQAGNSTSCHLPKGAFFFPGLRETLSVAVSPASIGQKGKTYVTAPEVGNYMDVQHATIRAILADATFEDTTKCSFQSTFHTGEGELLFRLKSLELNGNDAPEVLAVRKKFSAAQLLQIAQQASMPGGGGAFVGAVTSELVVLWDGQLGDNGNLAPYVPPGQPKTVTDYTVGDIDGDGVPELLVVGQDGAVGYKLGADKKSLQPSSAPLPDLAGAKAVLYADANGDGVLDLVVAQSGLQFFKGEPKPAAGTAAAATPAK